ncbi:MAG: gamma-glutamyl-gamma-aminobutyrate hydrolase family protein [Bacteroidetes bacterium]|nr:gamma-glutamyl-gamma-aminobutyrate hydrolase family protein [Bacteroidota bacterium]
MKKLLLIQLLILFSIVSFAQRNVLVLAHPTAYNLELFTNLTNKNIIEIDELRILGVYHEKETYDYNKSREFIQENNISNIELREIKETVSADKLFQANACSTSFHSIFENSKGIIFFGGPDLPPSIYNQQMSLLTRMTDPYRHYFEASFLFHLLGGSQNPDFMPLLEENPNYTVYAICLGMQTMNISTGGTMVQDIPTEIYHKNTVEEVLKLEKNQQHRNYNNNLSIDSTLFSGSFHQIKIQDNTPLTGDFESNTQPTVYSNHHQAIEKLGQNLKIIATSVDGKIIEAITHQKYPNVLGIQFHPEGTYLHNEEIKHRIKPTDELVSGKQILEDNSSYEFHLMFWKTFSKKIIP